MNHLVGKISVGLVLLGVSLFATPARAALTWVTCTPINTTTFASRVHVRCSQSFSGITYFAVSSANTAEAARFLSSVSSALLAGRNVKVHYDTVDTSGTAWGCQASDCRRAQGLELY